MGFQILLMEAELMNQSAEGYQSNNIGVIYVSRKLESDRVDVRCKVHVLFLTDVYCS